MKSKLRIALTLAGAIFASQAAAQVTFYENEGFGGRAFTTARQVGDFQRPGFSDGAASVVVKTSRWEVCETPQFGGQCMVLRPGRYASVASMGVDERVASVRPVAANARIDQSRYAPLPVVAQATFYEQAGFAGRSFSTSQPVANLARTGFNRAASSAVVVGTNWEVCDDCRYDGRCVVLRPGRYPSLESMGLTERVASVRASTAAPRAEPAPVAAAPAVSPDYRRQNDERIYQVPVSSVRAVVAAAPGQRCWMERAEVAPERAKPSVPGAVVGALLGGILGHQVGSGKGQDIATAGGAVAGGVIGAKVGGRVGGSTPAPQEVQRCENVSSQAAPDYWDVTYSFRGVEHRIQMSAPPGPTISVNERGEPRA